MGIPFEHWDEQIKHFISEAREQLVSDQKWFILDGYHRIIPADKHEWVQWAEAQGDGVLWVCATGSIRIVTLFFGVDQRLFETLRCSDTGEVEVIASYPTWADAEAGHRERLLELQRQR